MVVTGTQRPEISLELGWPLKIRKQFLKIPKLIKHHYFSTERQKIIQLMKCF